MAIKVQVGHKFIIGFIAVVAVTAFVSDFIELTGVTEWQMKPLTYLTAIVIGLILGSVFTKSFTRKVSHLTSAARRISGGDLSPVSVPGNPQLLRDETSELGEAIELMSRNLRGLVEHVREAVANLTSAQEILSGIVTKGHGTSGEVTRGTSSIVEGALEQAKQVEHSTLTVRAMAELADDVARKATETSNASQKVSSMVQRGAAASTSALEKMETIFKGIENTETAASHLKEKLGDIPRILDVITHIARQTDLLALNATIEASKAGEHGKGFAMVAEEFRRFADNTNDSVRDVSAVVAELSKEVERVVATASEGTSNLKGGREDLRRIREILADITSYTTDVVEKASLILGLTQEQKEKAGRTADTIYGISQITKENARNAKQMEEAVRKHGVTITETLEASRKLSELSMELEKAVSSFRIE